MVMEKKVSNRPYIGCIDYFPEEFSKLKYILGKWREIPKKYGYMEYLTPVLEYAEIYESKSGEDINKELFRLVDSSGRELALRPEMTPSVVRMVTQIYRKEPKPIRLYSIANFFRGEKPQKGRMREFWQLNVDIFGSNSIYADIEILVVALDLMKSFNAPEGSFTLKLNHRRLIDCLLSELLDIQDKHIRTLVIRKLDKYHKLERDVFVKSLEALSLSNDQIDLLIEWINYGLNDLVAKYPQVEKMDGYRELVFIVDNLKKLGYGNVVYSPDLIRGFDYYDGMIFEIFDNSKNFNRSLFGGGRYNGLASIFGDYDIPAVGFAPGSPISIFLDNWDLWPVLKDDNHYYLPILSSSMYLETLKLSSQLREKGLNIELSDSPISLSKALAYADRRQIPFVVIYGENELNGKFYTVRNMKTGTQEEVSLL